MAADPMFRFTRTRRGDQRHEEVVAGGALGKTIVRLVIIVTMALLLWGGVLGPENLKGLAWRIPWG